MPEPDTPSISNVEYQKVTSWHHSPTHVFIPNQAYMITASTLYKRHYFVGDERLTLLQTVLLEALDACQWRPQAWAVFPNHYHCVVLSPAPGQGKELKTLVQRIHSETARKVNAMDGLPGRRVWFQYRDTPLTFEKSYYARLNYTHNNAVKHGLVTEATQYPYCSAAWFEQTVPHALYRKIGSFNWDTIKVDDEYDVEWCAESRIHK